MAAAGRPERRWTDHLEREAGLLMQLSVDSNALMLNFSDLLQLVFGPQRAANCAVRFLRILQCESRSSSGRPSGRHYVLRTGAKTRFDPVVG